MKALAVGCFWFAPKGGIPKDRRSFNPNEFAQKIIQALERIESITNIEKFGNSEACSFRSIHVYPSEEVWTTVFANWIISFDIFIPSRLIKEYCILPTDSHEKFHIDVVFNMDLPVTYLSYDIARNEEETCKPSGAIVAVRKHLESKISNDPEIRFGIIGPTPFHADFIVDRVTDQVEPILVKERVKRDRGYLDLVFKVPESGDRALLNIIKEKNRDSSNYYKLVDLRNRSLSNSVNILATVEDMLSAPETQGPIASYKGYRTLGKEIDRISQTIIRERMQRVQLAKLITDSDRDNKMSVGTPLQRPFDELRDHDDALPWDDISDIIKLLEERRQKYISNAVAMLSGLLSGFAGAVLGSLLTYWLTQS